jgi:hypothetical protein
MWRVWLRGFTKDTDGGEQVRRHVARGALEGLESKRISGRSCTACLRCSPQRKRIGHYAFILDGRQPLHPERGGTGECGGGQRPATRDLGGSVRACRQRCTSPEAKTSNIGCGTFELMVQCCSVCTIETACRGQKRTTSLTGQVHMGGIDYC